MAQLLEAVDAPGPRYDAIVVDEGQDFEDDWWLLLQLLLNDPDAGILYVFYDSNQAIYPRPPGLPEDLVPYSLSENWRKQLGRLLHRLVNDEGFSPSGIVALTPRNPRKSAIVGSVGAFEVTPEPRHGRAIQLSSI